MEPRIRDINVDKDENGQYQMVQIVFGPQYFVELIQEGDRVKFCLGATHRGFCANASEVGGELEDIINEIRESHPELVPVQSSQADQIRQYVISELIEPARFAGRGHVIIRSGDVHKALGLHNRMPAVCGALDAAIFGEQAQIELVSRTGPNQSSTVEWVLRLK